MAVDRPASPPDLPATTRGASPISADTSETCPTTAPAQADPEPDDPIVIEENRWRRREGYHPLTREEADELNRVAKRARARLAQAAQADQVAHPPKCGAPEKTSPATAPVSPKAGPGAGRGTSLLILLATAALTVGTARADEFQAAGVRQGNTNVTLADDLLTETAVSLPHCSSLVTRHSSLVTSCEVIRHSSLHAKSLVTSCAGGNGRPPPKMQPNLRME
jgi:hypothetical protein